MKTDWLQYTVIRAASLLAPCDQRAELVREWRSELWYIPRRRAMLFSLGAFRDALWLRRNNLSSVTRTKIHLESPFSCLAFLSTLAALSTFVAVRLLAPVLEPSWPLTTRNLTGACIGMLLFSCLFLPGTLAVWRPPASRGPMPWRSGLRRGIFLALKIALVQPMMLCGSILQILMGQLGAFSILAFYAVFILGLRWVITDQQQRCPVCLRLLTAPIRIGSPSRTFLEWYGAESTCSRGHGLLHISENASSFSPKPQWLTLDNSWSGLFRGGQ
jgi:hypothetical protein